MPLRLALGLTSAVALVLAACGGAAAPAAPPSAAATAVSLSADGAQQLTLTVADAMRFDPSAMRVRVGQPVELTLRNQSQQPHDFSLAEGLSQPVKISADRGQTASAEFTFDRPGTYTFFCSFPGHQAAGMRGTITAE